MMRNDECAADKQHRECARFLREQPDRHGNLRRGELCDVERLDQRFGVLESRGRVLRRATVDRLGERRWKLRAYAAHRWERLGDLAGKHLPSRVRAHGRRAGEREVRRETEGIQVAPPVNVVAGRLLGAHVLRRADDLADAGKAVARGGRRDDPRDAEVHH